jgi:hypothetical protein
LFGAMRFGHGDVLAWPALRRTSKGETIPRHLQLENGQSETPVRDRSWGFLARRKVAELRREREMGHASQSAAMKRDAARGLQNMTASAVSAAAPIIESAPATFRQFRDSPTRMIMPVRCDANRRARAEGCDCLTNSGRARMQLASDPSVTGWLPSCRRG